MKTYKFFSIMGLLMAGVLSFSSCKKEETPEPQQPEMRTATFNYAFNTGQVGEGTAYNGMHPTNLTAKMTITEMNGNKAKVEVWLENTIEGESYMVHAHDAADPASTPNGTPYNESPNTNVLTLALKGGSANHNHRVGHSTAYGMQEANRSFDDLTTMYNAFFVVHDPTQPISTTDLSTYLVVGVFAR
ncbi:MAG: hypothetical protein ACK417_03150 [Bacteroidia bacterium]